MRSAKADFQVRVLLFQNLRRMHGIEQVKSHDAHGDQVWFDFPDTCEQSFFGNVFRWAVDKGRGVSCFALVVGGDIEKPEFRIIAFTTFQGFGHGRFERNGFGWDEE